MANLTESLKICTINDIFKEIIYILRTDYDFKVKTDTFSQVYLGSKE